MPHQTYPGLTIELPPPTSFHQSSYPGLNEVYPKSAVSYLSPLDNISPLSFAFRRGLSTPPPDMGSLENGGEYAARSLKSNDSHLYSYSSTDPGRNGSISQQYTPSSRRSSLATIESTNSISTMNSTISTSTVTSPRAAPGSKGSMSDFAAQITCLFWFESAHSLHSVAESETARQPQAPLAPDSLPTTGFRKWVASILSTTQVSQNVILLALLFIYRLKKMNPSVKGKSGSEFRLLTVALMLGNKFLDDNTYTNKTWAEVSGISVQEIHIMEVEFLSNMKYELYTSMEDFMDWQKKLHKFWIYWDKASRVPVEMPTIPIGPITPALTQSFPSLPSPPASTSSSPPFYGLPSPHLPIPAQHPMAGVPAPVVQMPYIDLAPKSRKRTLEDMAPQYPATKRVTRSMAPKINVTVPQYGGQLPLRMNPSSQQSVQRMAMANSMPSIPPMLPQMSSGNSLMSLPQLPAPGRAMAMVYPGPSPTVTTPNSAALSPFTHQSRHSSPFSGQPGSNNNSPTQQYPQNGQHLSPSVILTNRNSPYRPVHKISKLRFPPPHEPPQEMSFSQIHYLPLAKTRESPKTGVMPYAQPNDFHWAQSSGWLPPAFHEYQRA